MDVIRDVLCRSGVRQCVAFVIGRVASGEEERLRRWLEAGFELGNHTDGHLDASRVDPERFLQDVERCDRLLESIGAFRDGKRLFRFPYLNRGGDPAARRRIREGLQALGYTTVPGSVDFHDHLYEERFARSVRIGSDRVSRRIAERYLTVAVESVRHRAKLCRDRLGRDVIQIAYFHFGGISTQVLDELLSRLRDDGVEWCTVEEALGDPFYVDYDRDDHKNGLATNYLRSATLPGRALRRLCRWSERVGIARQRQLGPRWPFLR